MKNVPRNSFIRTFWTVVCLLAVMTAGLPTHPARAAAACGTYVPAEIAANTTWDLAGSPYCVDSIVTVLQGATLTIDPGVVVDSAYLIFNHYNFYVDGTLNAQGTAEKPITFNTTPDGWSGIVISGQDASHLNTGSVLDYVIVNGGGDGGTGVGGDLVLYYSVVTVSHSQFNDSPGDGILGNDNPSGGVAHVSDSSFANNKGYAINFENGSVNPILSNLSATGNGADLPYGGNFVAITGHGDLKYRNVWEYTGVDYLLANQVTVTGGAELVVEPGVKVYAAPGNDTLDVIGYIQANGTASHPIAFLPANPVKGWSGIQIVGEDAVDRSSGNQFKYVTVSKGGFGNACDLYLEEGDADIQNSQFSGSQDSGVCLGKDAILNMADTTLSNNEAYAIDVKDAGAQFTLTRLAASGNGSNSIGVNSGTMSGDHTWQKSGINTFDVYNSGVSVAATGSLTVEGGVTVRFDRGRNLLVNGSLTAAGSASDPVAWDGNEATPGYWAGIVFEGSAGKRAKGNFTYAVLQDGGYGGSAMVDETGADVAFDHTRFQNCTSDAIHIAEAPGLTASASGQPADATLLTAHKSQFTGIGGDAIDNTTGVPVDATQNWWGAASGPTAEDNAGGKGAAISGPVLYRPFMTGIYYIYLPTTIKQ